MPDSFTDFQINYSGLSSWYHLVEGSKKLFFVKLTEENLAFYKRLEKEDLELQEVFFPQVIKDKTYEI